MKTNTINHSIKSIVPRWYLLIFLAFALTTANAQVQNNGSLFVRGGGVFYIKAGNFAFGNGTGDATATTRPAPTAYGRVVFGPTATTSDATNNHFLDGYGGVISTSPFVIPVGQSSVYAPLRITPSTSAAVDAAYLRGNPTTVSSTLNPNISAVSTVEYWNVVGTNNATITLTWRASSNLSAIGIRAALDNLTIVGFNSSTSQWERITSVVDPTNLVISGASTIASGSITATVAANLAQYTHFSLGALDSCYPVFASTGGTKTWTGVWTPSGAPDLTHDVVINSPFSGTLKCNSLILNADVTLANNENVEIVNTVTGTGKIIMSSQANLLQRAGGTGANITLNKRTRSVMRQFDYIYWGSPIANFTLAQFATAQASTALLADAFDSKLKYVSAAGGGWQPLDNTAIGTAGKGFIARVKNQAPFTTPSATDFINLVFNGVSNNGDITVNITRDPAQSNGGRAHNLLANPYPSAIDADIFLAKNTSIDGSVYVWSAATLNAGVAQNYSQGDYMVYTRTGTVWTDSNASRTIGFTGKIASGQGFKVKSLVNTGTVTFDNCMRLTTDNNQFQKVKGTKIVERDSYKLNMTGANGVFSQILMSYIPEATLDYDRMYDAGRNSVSTAQLFSIFEGDGRKLAINARPVFDAADVVAIGMTKTGTEAETFTIAIDEKNGIFNTGGQSVYIYDTVEETYWDLNNGDFTFTTDKNILDRYKLAYVAKTLSNPKFDANGVVASLNNDVVTLQSSLPLAGIEIYDITGRKVLSSKIDNVVNFSTPFHFPKAVYVVKALLTNGTVSSVKVINKN